MIQCSVYIAVSLDGYIAREDGDINWLHNPLYTTDDGSDFGYSTFIAGIDTLVMGRKTFEKVLTFGEWPYGALPVVVLSTRQIPIPHALTDKVRTMQYEPADLVAHLEGEGVTHIYVDGGQTIQRFLQAGLITDMTLTIIPILLGNGIPLYRSLTSEVHASLEKLPGIQQ